VKPDPPIQKPAKSSPLPERRVRPGCETPAISAGADRRVVFDPRRKPACSSSGPLADVYSAVDTKADWQFTTVDARIKLKYLYPSI
jgi:hypothetical protein